MLANGFIDEVQRLRARGDLHTGLPSMRCVGYRQAWEMLDAGRVDSAALAVFRERGIAATAALARRRAGVGSHRGARTGRRARSAV